MLCYTILNSPKIKLLTAAAFTFLCAGTPLYPQAVTSASPAGASLTSTQIVDEMIRHNLARAEALKHYQSVRHYEVEYKGYSARLDAKLVVEATYDAATGKTFRIVSQSGNKMLVDKVLKRLIESEQDAAQDKSSTALTPANYKFTLAGLDTVSGRPAYVLQVEPLVESKFLYRGKIWVDTADFAVAQIQAEPAKNPSFWISSTAVNHRYVRTGSFWLPAQNRSETKVRVGGKAVLTIDYGKYDVVPESPVTGGGF